MYHRSKKGGDADGHTQPYRAEFGNAERGYRYFRVLLAGSTECHPKRHVYMLRLHV